MFLITSKVANFWYFLFQNKFITLIISWMASCYIIIFIIINDGHEVITDQIWAESAY